MLAAFASRTVITLVMILAVSSVAGCQSPGDVAAASLDRSVETLVALVERRDRGELDQVALTAALHAWLQSEGSDLALLSDEAARSLAPGMRAMLALRWRDLAQRLSTRLGRVSAEDPGLP